jgi:hypothetical protein
VAAAGTAFSTHSWRAAAAGHLWGWQITRSLYLLVVLMGAIGEPGGVNLNATNKFVPKHPNPPPAPDYWNELLFPKEFPLAFFEMSFLLPHFLKEGRGRLDTYFTRVYNPLWTNPDGFTWMEVLQDESKIGMHVALTPIWSETAWFADFVLPMGLGTERHDTMSQETHAGRWLGFRQPVARVAREKRGEKTTLTHESNPGEVWEESEFWIALSWKIDPDGSLGIRKFFESPYRPGEKITVDEYYGWIFENSVPGLPRPRAPKASRRSSTCASTARSRSTRSPTARATSRWWTNRRQASSSMTSGAPVSTRRHGSSSSIRRRLPPGDGRNTRFRTTRPATCTGATSIDPPTSSTCCRTSGCRRSFTRDRPSSGSTRSRTTIRCGLRRATRPNSALSQATS